MPYGIFYGFQPIEKYGVKLAEHVPGKKVPDPSNLDRALHDDDRTMIERFLKDALPWVRPKRLRHAACMYTMTPDGNFVIDRHPAHENVHFAAGFSGHGFKFSSVVGEILADLSLGGKTAHMTGFLKLRWG